MNYKLNIRYTLSKSRIRQDMKAPLKCRLTFNKERKEFSTGLFIIPSHWNSKNQKILENSDNENYINTQLSLIRQKLHQAFLFLQVQEIDFDVNDIYKQYTGELPKKQITLLRVFKLHNEKVKALIAKVCRSERNHAGVYIWVYK